MRIRELFETRALTESIDFGVAVYNKEGGYYDSSAFAKDTEQECWYCDGSGKDPCAPKGSHDVTCERCKGKGTTVEPEYPYPELNVANANAAAIFDMLGLPYESTGMWSAEQLPLIRRKLIRIKNGDVGDYTEEPSTNERPMQRYQTDDGQDAIGRRGPQVVHAGRTNAQVTRYIDNLLAIIDFAQKNGAVVSWG